MTLITALDILSADSRATNIPGTAAQADRDFASGHDVHRMRGGGSNQEDNATTVALPTVVGTGASTKVPVRMSIALRPMDSQLSMPHGGDGSDLPSSGRNSPFESMSASAVSSASSSFSSDSSSSSNASFASATADILEAMETIPPLQKGSKKTGKEDIPTPRKQTTTTTSTSDNMTSSLPPFIQRVEASNSGKQQQQQQQHRVGEERESARWEGLEREKRNGEEGSGESKRKEAAEEELKEERQQNEQAIAISSSSSSKRGGSSKGRGEEVYAISSTPPPPPATTATTTVIDKKKTLLAPNSTTKKKGLFSEPSPSSSSRGSSMFSSPSPFSPSSLPPSSSSSSTSPMDDPELCSSTSITFRQSGQGGREGGIEEGFYEDEGGSVCSGGFGMEEGEGVFEAPTFESFMSREAAAKREAVKAGWRAMARVVVAAALIGIVVWVFVMYK